MSEQYDDLHELPAPPRKDIAPADLELLTLAARALGATFEEVDGEGYGNLHFDDGQVVNAWNPLQFSGDAFDLAAKLSMAISHWPNNAPPNVMAGFYRGNVGDNVTVPYGFDALAATRRAVTRAAAQFGLTVPPS